MIGDVPWKALEAGLIFLIWREALSSEEPVGGASGTGVMDEGVVVFAFTPQTPVDKGGLFVSV